MADGKLRRIRDPIHGLISFDMNDPIEQLCWTLLDCREFQRLRRVKQLGFSELVYPGATHTRIAHSVGVFNNARKLLRTIAIRTGQDIDEYRKAVVLCSALLHDIGHGPFSHAFESALKPLEEKRDHEKWSAAIIQGDTEIRTWLDRYDPRLADDVAALLRRRDPVNIYDSVVHSQFDADRLDYVCRDRYMTGIGSGAVDTDWLFDCLDVGTLPLNHGGEEDDVIEAQGFFLNGKGLQAAEGYLLGRYHLYQQVYLHKTTRSAEKMLTALISAILRPTIEGRVGDIGLRDDDVLVRFLRAPMSLSVYLSLDDTVMWAALERMAGAPDVYVAELATRLRDRRLFKCIDIGERAAGHEGDQQELMFRKRLGDTLNAKRGKRILEDRPSVSAYSRYGSDEQGAFQRVMAGSLDPSKRPTDIRDRSNVIKALESRKLYRVYVAGEDESREVEALWEDLKR